MIFRLKPLFLAVESPHFRFLDPPEPAIIAQHQAANIAAPRHLSSEGTPHGFSQAAGMMFTP